MKNRQLLLSILTVGLALGTAWAIRGRFGHEQGAAWAGAIGALSLILVAKRQDWYEKTFRIAMAAAFGWGVSGVMSYGAIVGYGRGTDFFNVYYGLLMLFVLGVLYGIIGGGMVGLALADSKENRVRWHSVLVQMIAMGLLVYAILINQLGWLMTPPRSEMWAACLGAGIALVWYLVRNRHQNVLKVAIWSALGAGFGFAFGNFLQVLGNASGIQFNFWNVMEYSIGFFGGIGMAYGTFTTEWPKTDGALSTRGNLIPILFVALFVPFVVWEQSFVTDRLDFIPETGPAELIFWFKLVAILSILSVASFLLLRNARQGSASEAPRTARQFFILYTLLYIFLSFLITGILVHPLEQYLYVVNFLVILYLVSRVGEPFQAEETITRRWVLAAVLSVVAIAVFAIIAIHSHEGMHGSNVRFNIR